MKKIIFWILTAMFVPFNISFAGHIDPETGIIVFDGHPLISALGKLRMMECCKHKSGERDINEQGLLIHKILEDMVEQFDSSDFNTYNPEIKTQATGLQKMLKEKMSQVNLDYHDSVLKKANAIVRLITLSQKNKE